MKVFYEYAMLHNVNSYLIVDVGGELAPSSVKVGSLFTSLVGLDPFQRKLLLYLTKRGVASVDEMTETVGVSKWTFYKTLLSFIEGDIIERVGHGFFKLTLIGEILVGLGVKEALNYEQS